MINLLKLAAGAIVVIVFALVITGSTRIYNDCAELGGVVVTGPWSIYCVQELK